MQNGHWPYSVGPKLKIFQRLEGFHSQVQSFCLQNAREVASSNTSPLEAHSAFFRLLMKEILDPYVCTVTFRQKVDLLISNTR